MIFHVFTDYTPKEPDTLRRINIAKVTWAKQRWTEVPLKDSQLPALWHEEGRSLPYIKDIFDVGCSKTNNDQDILCYTNADICVRSDCSWRLATALQESDAIYGFRRDFGRFDAPKEDHEIASGHAYAGSDIYAFRVHWWKTYRNEFPALIAGFEAWDACLRHMVDFTNPGRNNSIGDLIYHEKHNSFWEDPKNRYRLAGQRYCLKTAAQWLKKHKIDPAIHGIRT